MSKNAYDLVYQCYRYINLRYKNSDTHRTIDINNVKIAADNNRKTTQS